MNIRTIRPTIDAIFSIFHFLLLFIAWKRSSRSPAYSAFRLFSTKAAHQRLKNVWRACSHTYELVQLHVVRTSHTEPGYQWNVKSLDTGFPRNSMCRWISGFHDIYLIDSSKTSFFLDHKRPNRDQLHRITQRRLCNLLSEFQQGNSDISQMSKICRIQFEHC